MVHRRPINSPRSALKDPDHFRRRILLFIIGVCVCFGFIIVRLVFLQIISASTYAKLADNQHSIYEKLNPVRGEIKISDKFSTQPYTVATSIEKQLVYAVPSTISDPRTTADKLGFVIGMTSDEIYAKISDPKKKYVQIKHQLTDDEVSKIKVLKLTGISFDSEPIRYYPENSFLSNVLGYVGFKDSNKTGFYGLEQSKNTELTGQPGSLDQEKDSGGAWIFNTRRNYKPAINGDNLILTVDKSIQLKAEEIIHKAVSDNGADSGTIIVMDPHTGAVLSMANYPSFDPNNYSKTKNVADFNNMATVGSYEPGSIFKPLTMAAAVNEGKVTAETTFTDTGKVEVDGYTIKNSDSKAHGVRTMSQVLEQSLNTGAIFAKDQIGNAKFLEYVKRFGFGQPTGIDLPEAKGSLKGLDGNVKVNYDTSSFGQGISVTPIQMMQAFSVLANNGAMVRPYIIQSRITDSGKTFTNQPKTVGQVISSRAAAMTTGMLVNVVELGHGKKAGVPGYYVAGKTGTAQVPRTDGPGYDPHNNIGTFIGYAPADNPKFLMMIRVNHPRDVSFAETSAAPSWGVMAQFLLNYYDVAPTRPITAKK